MARESPPTDCVILGEVGASGAGWSRCLDGVRVGTTARYSHGVPLHVDYGDPALLSTIPGLALVV